MPELLDFKTISSFQPPMRYQSNYTTQLGIEQILQLTFRKVGALDRFIISLNS